jgi:hypothetical protein
MTAIIMLTIRHLLIMLNAILTTGLIAVSHIPRYVTIFDQSLSTTWYPMLGIAFVCALLMLNFFAACNRHLSGRVL